jgi:hypothetical protein
MKKRTLRVTTLERSVAKQFATGGLNQVLGCTKLTLAPTGSHINKQLQVVKLRVCTLACTQTLTLISKSKKGHNLIKMKVRIMVLGTHTYDGKQVCQVSKL